MKHIRTQGFSVVEILLVIVVLAIIGLLGYMFLTRSQMAATNHSDTSEVAAPEIKQTADLDTAQSVVDSTDPDTALDDLDQLDKEAESF